MSGHSIVNGMFTFPKTGSIFVVGNQAYAGWDRYVSHGLAENEKYTLCGVSLVGDWQITSDENKDVTCKKCKKCICAASRR